MKMRLQGDAGVKVDEEICILARLNAGYAHALLRGAAGGACHSHAGFCCAFILSLFCRGKAAAKVQRTFWGLGKYACCRDRKSVV